MDKPTLTAQDRCDRCGAQAKCRTMHDTPDGPRPLQWCIHHFKKHEDPLTPHLVLMTPEARMATQKEPQQA